MAGFAASLPIFHTNDATVGSSFTSDDAVAKAIFQGVLEGFISKELPDVTTCVHDSTTTAADFKAAVADFETKTIDGIVKGLRETADGLTGLKAAMTDCKAAESEIQSLEAALAQMSSPSKLAYHVGKELIVNGKDILTLVEAAVTQYKAASYEDFGKDLGAIVGDLVGKPIAPPSVEVAATAGAACSDAADQSVWAAKKSSFQTDMTSCGKKCLGGSACVTSCIESTDGYSATCASCFGGLAQCTKDHCMLKCAGGNTPDCAACVKAAGCDTTFSACSGIPESDLPPSAL